VVGWARDRIVKRIPSIATEMTPFPYSIDAGADISDARGMMEEHDIQHLPVMENGALVGLLADRDLRVARELQRHVPQDGITVGKVCNRAPYIVDMSERLDHVAFQMADRRVGAAVVVRQGKLAGILTTTDVCRLLAELLRATAHVLGDDGDGGDAA
jgi:CBS domain-containing protein